MLSRLFCVLLVITSIASSPAPANAVLAQANAVPAPGRAPAGFDVTEKSIADLQEAMQAGQVTSRQLVELYLARIAAYDRTGPALNAITVLNPEARPAADALDAERRSGRVRGPLHGIPILVKDNYETVEMPTSAGSIALAAFHPRRDAFQVRRLKDAGAVILGKTNMHELAAGITTVGSRFGQTRNPYDLERNPGGSSGGTGAAIAASFAAAGMGSDTCGSIRIPAANNNLVGLRGTQGLASRTGIVPLSSTQDIGGPIARNIVDLAIMLDATVGVDPADANTAAAAGKIPSSYRAALRSDALQGIRIGVLRSLFGTAQEDQEVSGLLQKTLDAMKAAGADVSDVVVPGLDDLLRDSSMINADFKFDLADYLAGAPDAPVRTLGEILDRGLYHAALESNFRLRNNVERRDTDSARRARIKRVALRQAVEAVLEEHRLAALVYPTLRRKPARIGDAQPGSTCQLSAHSGLPAISVPAAFTTDELPVGIELLGGAFQEQALLSLGYSIEQLLKLRRVPFSTPPLVGGKAPAPRTAVVAGGTVSVRFEYDRSTSRLAYAITRDPQVRDQMVDAVWLHAGTVDKPGAARHQLSGAGSAFAGEVTLSASDRRELEGGRMIVRFYNRPPGPPVISAAIPNMK
jgi:Asp-tRNA(Asn)/Glu-tRNA(Gln) amidotransferase A subunit family amidase